MDIDGNVVDDNIENEIKMTWMMMIITKIYIVQHNRIISLFYKCNKKNKWTNTIK
jgi:hypothetical protein